MTAIDDARQVDCSPGTAYQALLDSDSRTVPSVLRWRQLASVFEQGMFNLPQVQRGLRTTSKPGVTFSAYQEAKIRHFHRLLDEQLSRP